MSGGDIGPGMSYWANIKISGDLDGAELTSLKKQIETILQGQVNGKAVKGSFASEARLSDNANVVSFNANY
jgi:hypothetical protein